MSSKRWNEIRALKPCNGKSCRSVVLVIFKWTLLEVNDQSACYEIPRASVWGNGIFIDQTLIWSHVTRVSWTSLCTALYVALTSQNITELDHIAKPVKPGSHIMLHILKVTLAWQFYSAKRHTVCTAPLSTRKFTGAFRDAVRQSQTMTTTTDHCNRFIIIWLGIPARWNSVKI